MKPALTLTLFLFRWKEFEIELEGSQTLRLLCYEKSCNKTRHSKEDGEITDKIVAKGQMKVQAGLQKLDSNGTVNVLQCCQCF